MDFRKLGEEIVAKAIKWGAGEAEACLENVKSFEVNVRKGEIETLTKSVSRGLGLRIFINKQLGFAYTSDLSAGAVDETIKKAIELAGITEPKPWQGLPDFGPQSLADLDIYDSRAGLGSGRSEDRSGPRSREDRPGRGQEDHQQRRGELLRQRAGVRPFQLQGDLAPDAGDALLLRRLRRRRGRGQHAGRRLVELQEVLQGAG